MKLLRIFFVVLFGCLSLHSANRIDRMDDAPSPTGTPPGSAQASPFDSPSTREELEGINGSLKGTPRSRALAARLAGLALFKSAEERSPKSQERRQLTQTIPGAGQTRAFQTAPKTSDRKRLNDGDSDDDENQEREAKKRRLVFMEEKKRTFADKLRKAAAVGQRQLNIDALENEAAAAGNENPTTRKRKEEEEEEESFDQRASKRRQCASSQCLVNAAAMNINDDDPAAAAAAAAMEINDDDL
jgi:hypothetical protein